VTSIIVPVGPDGRWSADLGALAPGSRPLRIRSRAGGISAWRDQRLFVPPQFLREATWDFDFINRRAWIENVRGQGVSYLLEEMLGQMTFTRASAGRYYDAEGDYVAAAADVLRFDHDPATLAPRGILIEGSRTNLALRSQEFLDAVWAGVRTAISAAGAAPDGGGAFKITEAANSGTHSLVANVGSEIIVIDGNTYTFSAFVKAGERTRCGLQGDAGAGYFGTVTTFDLSSGSVLSLGSTAVSASIAPVGGGWFRVSITAPSTGTTARPGIFVVNAAGNTSYTGDGTSGLYAWGAQFEAGAGASSDIATTTASATRAADALTAAVAGWLNLAAGTAVPQWRCPFVAGTTPKCVFSIDDGTANNRITLWAKDASGNVMFEVVVGGVQQCVISGGAAVAGQAERVAVSWKANQFALSRNGGSPVTDSAGSIPTGLTTLRKGSTSAGQHLFGTLARLPFLPVDKAGSALQALSA